MELPDFIDGPEDLRPKNIEIQVPIKGENVAMTPLEILDAISIMSSILVAYERNRQ